MPPVETAIWWVEYVLRHKGAPHLRPSALDLTWYQYFMLDILLIVIISLMTGLCLVYLTVKLLIKCLQSLSSKKISTTKNNKMKTS